MSPSYLFIVFIALCAFTHVFGDMYMQNPRGNNDRLNEEGDRDNANRLFDSQNNAAGGYSWGPELTYIEGSELSIQWTSQHSCGVANTACQVVMQYMCTSDAPGADVTQIIRDGTTTNTIPTGTTYNTKNAAGQYVYGMNENNAYYQASVARSRNKGLFTAQQNVVNTAGAQATRQNPTGTQYGYECTEENDYYPYWHPSPWKDIAVMTTDTTQCPFFQANSQNVLAKNYCAGTTTAQKAANNEADCSTAAGTWVNTGLGAAFNISAPDCLPAPISRDNHLGNGVDGQTNGYNWTLPLAAQEDCIDNGNCTCVLRVRYNITLGELDGTEDATQSGSKSPVLDDPNVAVGNTQYTLAIDTAQTGRTFQDRSYMFRIAPRPAGLAANAKIYNVNVRGKRGNIVQTYPATEYDFVPTNLEVNAGDAVHFQWTGSDTNPAANAGEGLTSTDRSNIVQLDSISMNTPAKNVSGTGVMFQDPAVAARFANVDQPASKCLTNAQLQKAANAGTAVDQNVGNCMLLNAAPARFTGGIVTFDNADTSFAYMSTRNNNFSNRSQKATIKVLGPAGLSAAKTGGIVAGVIVAVAVGALAGTIIYAKRNPHSRAADFIGKIPGLNKI
jgi:plastocyanin